MDCADGISVSPMFLAPPLYQAYNSAQIFGGTRPYNAGGSIMSSQKETYYGDGLPASRLKTKNDCLDPGVL